jgi:hypothetical protein
MELKMAKRHWAEVRKILEEDFLCDSLKGQVRFFTTRYRNAHDDIGRVCVLVGGNEKLNMPFSVENDKYAETDLRKSRETEMSFREIHKNVCSEFAEKGLFDPSDFGLALDEFLSTSIKTSLYSDNLIIRMLAILDRRVGKRTLKKIKSDIPNLPEWLQFFYNLRIESEKV